jgi:anti-anti-sigma regulatory factor
MSDPDSNSQLPFDWYRFFAESPIAAQIYNQEGYMIAVNQASANMWGSSADAMSSGFNILTDPQLVQAGIPALFKRVLQGETITSPPHFFDTAQLGMEGNLARQRWVESTYFPMHNQQGAITHVGLIHREVTAEIQQREAVQNELAAQRETVVALSTPVVRLWEGILMVPLVGVIDTSRATTITENLLEAIVHYQAESVILDITGVATVDTQVANYLLSAASACRLLGSQVALVGLGSEVAQTIVHLGVDLSSIVTRADLQAGLAWAFERQHVTVSKIAAQAHAG